MIGDLERIRDALSYVPADDRETWVRMAMAVKSDIGEAGFEVWDAWSQGAESYRPADARDVWRSVKGNGKVTAGTLYHEAKTHGWCDDGIRYQPSAAELSERQRQSQERAERERADIERERAECAAKAAALWRAASPAQPDHPYLRRKGVAPVPTLRELPAERVAELIAYAPKSGGELLSGRVLVAPVKVGGDLSTVELIDETGRKAALAGRATKSGGYWAAQPLPERDDAELTLVIGEGVATVLSGREASGHPAVAALTSGNLASVARQMRERYPSARLVLLADLLKANGAPDSHAIEAARSVGGLLAVPDFGAERADGATDFNDLARLYGADAVRVQIQGAALPTQPKDTESAEPAPPPTQTGVTLIAAAGIRPEPVSWLWPGWLARGKLAVLAGAPGTGKTTVAIAVAATLTVGGRWPGGSRAEVGSVLIWSGEDDPRDTLVPRLIAAGADCERVQFVASVTDEKGPRPFDPATDAAALSDALADLSEPPALLVVDPIVSAVAGDSHKNAEVRRALQPLVELAQLRRCAVLGVSHFSKGTAGRDPTERVTGSLAFGALARVVLATAKLPDEEGGGRILARAKSNLGPDSGGFGYDLEPLELPNHPGVYTTRILWGEALDGTARELLSRAESQGDPQEQSATSEAVDWLRAYLETGPAKAKDVQREARECGISEKALRTARERLGIKPTKSGFAGGWRWQLPVEDALSNPKMPEGAEHPERASWASSTTGGHLGGTEDALEDPKMPTSRESAGSGQDGHLGDTAPALVEVEV